KCDSFRSSTKLSMNFLRRMDDFVLHTSRVLIGYSRMMESNSFSICFSDQTNGRWIFGNQKPPSRSSLFRYPTTLRIESFLFFMIPSYKSSDKAVCSPLCPTSYEAATMALQAVISSL